MVFARRKAPSVPSLGKARGDLVVLIQINPSSLDRRDRHHAAQI